MHQLHSQTALQRIEPASHDGRRHAFHPRGRRKAAAFSNQHKTAYLGISTHIPLQRLHGRILPLGKSAIDNILKVSTATMIATLPSPALYGYPDHSCKDTHDDTRYVAFRNVRSSR